MFKKLKRFWFYNRREIKIGLGSMLSLLGLIIIINSFPLWVLTSLLGGGILGGGVKILFDI